MESTVKNHTDMSDLELIDHVLLNNVAGGRRSDEDDYLCIEASCGGSRGCSAIQDYERYCGG